jgi:hypothetical protein
MTKVKIEYSCGRDFIVDLRARLFFSTIVTSVMLFILYAQDSLCKHRAFRYVCAFMPYYLCARSYAMHPAALPNHPLPTSVTPTRNRCSFIVKFLHNQMQEQIHVHPQHPALEELHELRVVELRL